MEFIIAAVVVAAIIGAVLFFRKNRSKSAEPDYSAYKPSYVESPTEVVSRRAESVLAAYAVEPEEAEPEIDRGNTNLSSVAAAFRAVADGPTITGAPGRAASAPRGSNLGAALRNLKPVDQPLPRRLRELGDEEDDVLVISALSDDAFDSEEDYTTDNDEISTERAEPSGLNDIGREVGSSDNGPSPETGQFDSDSGGSW